MHQNKYLRSFGRTKGHKLSQNQENTLKDFLPKIRPNKEVLKSKPPLEDGKARDFG